VLRTTVPTGPRPSINVETLRDLFPALTDASVRLDGPGGSQTPRPVLDAMTDYLVTSNANLGGVFAHSLATADLVATARARAGGFFGADTDEVGFGLNATAINFALTRAATRTLRPGDEIVLTTLDHDANVAPWRHAALDRDLVIRTVGVGDDTRLDMAGIAQMIGERTRIVTFPYANNATGTAVDVARVARLAHSVGAIVWADANQWAPHRPLDVRALGVDVAICSAYKFFGPHLGLFYGRRELLETWRPYQLDHAAHGPAAARFEHGTLPFESLAGLLAAFDYLDHVGWDFITGHERVLGERFLAGLPDRWRLHGVPDMDDRTATFALTLPGHRPQELARSLAAQGIAVGAGGFHATGIMDALGLPDGAMRIGLMHYNTEAEVDRTLEALTAL
jgi:cysteine desulfurase family protein (TIGR01976 family)